MNIADYIPTGKINAIKSKELEHMTGIDSSNIRKSINDLRSNGVPICSSQRGYYIAESNKEILSTISQLNHRIYMMIRAKEGMRKAVEDESQ